ncbi:MAG: hypothetical protein KIT85_00320 [Pseudolabrys sp.]|nr:hypothetical protein [Pseudolabrys sp.]
MNLSISKPDLVSYVNRQLDVFFPDGASIGDLARIIDVALGRLEYCFSHIRVKRFFDDRGPSFDHLHTDQYAMFLYFVSNSAFKAEHLPLAKKAFALNKALHAVDILYEVNLPDIFCLAHPMGTTLGRASYGDYFCCYHNCTVGSNLEGEYPTLGRGVVMYSGSRVTGRSRIADNTFVATGAIIRDRMELPGNSVLYGASPDIGVSATKRNVMRDVFRMNAAEQYNSDALVVD